MRGYALGYSRKIGQADSVFHVFTKYEKGSWHEDNVTTIGPLGHLQKFIFHFQMVAKGKDVSDLFPAVVKNVVSKNAEVKKLVFVYLVRYAEEQQDLALLSISTFQRALKVII